MSTAITPFVPENLEQAEKLSVQLAKSALLPEALRGKPGDVLVVLITGSELGLSPMQSVRGLHVIKGKAIMSADLQVALTKRHPDCIYFRMTESSVRHATFETLRKGDPKPTSMTFTMEDAARAGLAQGDTWKKYPAAMLRARCSSSLARAVFPDLMLGVYEEDEARAFGHRPEIELNPEGPKGDPAPVVEGRLAAPPDADSPPPEQGRRLIYTPPPPVMIAGQLAAPQDAAAKEVREPPKPSRVAEARRKAEEKMGKASPTIPPEPTPPPEPTVERDPEELVTPLQALWRLGQRYGKQPKDITSFAMGAIGKAAGFTHADIARIEQALGPVGK